MLILTKGYKKFRRAADQGADNFAYVKLPNGDKFTKKDLVVMENILMFHNDWITYDYKNLVINEYPNKYFTPSTFQDALIRQAKVIYKDVPTVFLSGGIDSQAIALGFIMANLDVEYVYIRPSYHGHYNKLDYLFVTQFCSKHLTSI